MITVATDEDLFSIDAPISISVENLKALLEADSTIPAAQQSLYFNTTLLEEPTKSLEDYGVTTGDLLVLRTSSSSSGGQTAGGAGQTTQAAAPQTQEAQMERLRQLLLTDGAQMDQLRRTHPQIAEAVNNQAEFYSLLRQETERSRAAERARAQAEYELATADEFDVDAQRRIEEAIREEQVYENLQHAMEYSPESFGTVTMLYVETLVNGTPVKAFVDSGAQATIMNPECAERCGIMRLIDRRFAGTAVGVGTAKILGRVHSAQMKLGDLHLPCSFTIMEGKGVELLLGLDMLKRFQATIDLAKNCLVVQEQSLRFLDEHELPASARALGQAPDGAETQGEGSGSGGAAAAIEKSNAAAANTLKKESLPLQGGSFQGSGQRLGGAESASGSGTGGIGTADSAGADAADAKRKRSVESFGFSWNHDTPASSGAAALGSGSSSTPAASAAPAGGPKEWPPASVQTLTDLGATKEQARALLDAAGGNVDVAASFLFQ